MEQCLCLDYRRAPSQQLPAFLHGVPSLLIPLKHRRSDVTHQQHVRVGVAEPHHGAVREGAQPLQSLVGGRNEPAGGGMVNTTFNTTYGERRCAHARHETLPPERYKAGYCF